MRRCSYAVKTSRRMLRLRAVVLKVSPAGSLPPGATPARYAFLAVFITPFAIALVSLPGCSAGNNSSVPTAEPTGFRPLLRELTVSHYPTPGEVGQLYVTALLADSAFALPAEARLRVEVRTTGGDDEALDLPPHTCTDPQHRDYACSSFLVRTRTPEDISRLGREGWGQFPRVEHRLLGANLVVLTLDSGDVRDAMRSVRQLPGVLAVEPNWLGCAGGNCRRYGASMQRIVRLSSLSIHRADSNVQARPGDTVRVSYLQPTGRRLSAEAVVTAYR